MPDQFVVPQFIDAEDKILGPITVRQFVILMIAFMLVAVYWKLLPFIWFLVGSIPTVVIAGIIAFTKINGQPFHFFILNLVQTLKRPQIRVWDKTPTDQELRLYATRVAPPPPVVMKRKASLSSGKLQELTLVVNTGGVYRPDEYEG